MKNKKRLSFDAMKAKAQVNSSQEDLNKIVGGILGACHRAHAANQGG